MKPLSTSRRKIYEGNALGKLPDARYRALDAQYAKEQDALEIEIAELEKAVTGYERARKGSQDTTQEIEIYFNFLGRYIPPSLQPVPLTPEEQEELRKKKNARTGFIRII